MTEPAITPELIQKHNLTPDEFGRIKEVLGREPNYTELGIFSVMWSEHCSYKNTRPLLKTFPTKSKKILVGAGEENAGIIDIGDGLAIAFKIESHNHPSAVEPFQGAATGVGGIVRDIFTMGARPVCALNSLRFGPIVEEEVADLNRHRPQPSAEFSLLNFPGEAKSKAAHFGAQPINLGEVCIEDEVIAAIPRHIARKYRVVPVFKHGENLTVALVDPSDLETVDNLTHLLRTQIDLRVASEADIEAALQKYYKYSGDGRNEDKHKERDQIANNRRLFGGVVAGIAHYGNCFGIPTVAGEVYFDKSYEGNPLVNAFCLGVLRHEQIVARRGQRHRQPGVLRRPGDRPRRPGGRGVRVAGFDGGIRRAAARRGAGGRSVHGKARLRSVPRTARHRRGRRHPGHGRGRADLLDLRNRRARRARASRSNSTRSRSARRT